MIDRPRDALAVSGQETKVKFPKLHIPHPSVLLAGLATAMAIMPDQALYVILPVPAWQAKLGLGMTDVGILLSVNRFVRLLTNHWAERLVRKVDATVLFVCVLVLGAGVAAMYGTWPIMWVMLIGRVLWGFCWSIIRQVGIMTSVDTAGRDKVASVVGFYNGLSRCGSIVGMLVAGWLCNSVGQVEFRNCFWVLGAVSLLATIPGAIARRGIEGRHSEFRRPRESKATDHLPSLLVCGFVAGCVGTGMIVSTLGYVLQRGFGASITIGAVAIGITTVNGWMLAVRYGILALGSPALGWLVDRIGDRKSAFAFFCVGASVLVAVAGISLTANVVMMLILLVLVMAFFICGTGLMVALTSEAGRYGSKTFSWYVSASDLGAASGPLLAWTLLKELHAPVAVFAVCAAFFSVGTLLAFGRMRRQVGMGAAGDAPARGE